MHLITQLTKPGVDEVTQHFAVHTIENVVLKVRPPSRSRYALFTGCFVASLDCTCALVVEAAFQRPALLLRSSTGCVLLPFAYNGNGQRNHVVL